MGVGDIIDPHKAVYQRVETDFRPLFDTILIIAPAEASTLEDPEQPAGQDD